MGSSRWASSPAVPVRNLGVNEWAWRKGQEHGTILVNLDVRRVVDLLPDRQIESFSEWLCQHSEVVSIARDRCGISATGAKLGAPQSQQIADQSSAETLYAMERVLEEHNRN